MWNEAEFIGQKKEVQGTNRFWFKLKSETPVEYKAGQFLTFDLPMGEKRAQRWRSYSIANTFDGSNIIELCISYKSGGLASQYLFEELNKGEIIKYKGPEGAFVTPDENTDNALILICTGAGIAPFRAMLQDIEKRKLNFSKIHLLFGTRNEKSILYFEELEDWAHFLPNMKIDICLSREDKLPKDIKNISFHNGYIQPVLANQYKGKLSNTRFMICGWTKMIDDTVALLINDLKVNRENIKYELFG